MSKTHAAGWDSASPSPAQLKEFLAQIESGRVTKWTLQEFLRRGQHMLDRNEQTARNILGDDIVLPNDFCEARRFSDTLTLYMPGQLQQLWDTFPSPDLLAECKERQYAIVPGPSRSVNLVELYALEEDLFCPEDLFFPRANKGGNWFLGHNFAQKEMLNPGWLVIMKTPAAGCEHYSLLEQQNNMSPSLRVPTAVELVWFLAVLYRTRGEKYFSQNFGWTSSAVDDRQHAIVGGFKDGLQVVCWGHSTKDDLGNYNVNLAVAKQL